MRAYFKIWGWAECQVYVRTRKCQNATLEQHPRNADNRTDRASKSTQSPMSLLRCFRAVDRARGGSEYYNPLAAGHRDISISTVLLLSLGGRVNGETGHSGVSRLTGGALSGFNGGAFKLLHNEHEMMRSTVIEHVSGSRRACPHLV
jgi:hypothetical protein